MFTYLVEDTDGEIAVLSDVTSDQMAEFAKAYSAGCKVGVSVYAGSDGKHIANYEPNGSVIYFS